MTSGSWPEEGPPLANGPCCLVRSFHSVASRFPKRIAVLHVPSSSTASTRSSDRLSGRGLESVEHRKSGWSADVGSDSSLDNPGRDEKLQNIQIDYPVFGATRAGDAEYTYGELLSAVDSLAELLSHILLNCGHGAAVVEGREWEDDALLEIPEAARVQSSGSITCGSLPEGGVCERRIGIMMVQSAEYLVSLLAVMMTGAAFVPLDLSWPPGRLEGVARTSKLCLVICCHHVSWSSQRGGGINVSRLATTFRCPVLSLRDGFVKSVNTKACAVRQDICRCNAAKTSYAYVLYTSGSTGNPRGVCGTEIGLVNRLRWMEATYPHVDDDVACFKSAIGFVDHLTEALGPLLAGTLLIIPSQSQLAKNPLALYDVLQDYRITRLVAVPSLLRALLPRLQDQTEGSRPLALRVLVLSGELLHFWLWKVLDHVFLKTTILNLYGSTEVSGDCMYFDCSVLRYCELTTSTVPIGKPISGCDACVVSASGSAVASGEGELWVAGAGVAYGYLDDPEHTAKRFLQTWPSNDVSFYPVLLKCPIFKTGDLATLLPDGNILLLGRNDRLVKLHGQRIDLEEVEAVLQSHRAVTHAAVSIMTSPNGELHLRAYVVPTTTTLDFSAIVCEDDDSILGEAEDCRLLLTGLTEWLLERLPSYMVPHKVVILRAMPLTGSGKVDYGMLSKSALAHGGIVDHEKEEDYGAIQKIVRVFGNVLNVNHVSSSDDFFALGGTSISAAHVAHMLGIDMALLYSHPTPKDLQWAISTFQPSSSWSTTPALQKMSGTSDGGVSRPVGRSGSPAAVIENMLVAERLPGSTSQQKKRKHGQVSIVERFIQTDHIWPSHRFFAQPVGLSRCNNIISQGPASGHPAVARIHLPLDEPRHLKPCWKFCLNSCVDGSPLVVNAADRWRLFIGSHGKNVVCLDAASGQVLWETQVGGRIESSAVLNCDFHQVVIGCYDGLIYFLDFITGSIIWTFKTGGEVKCQPTLDSCSGLIWCGSHDHKVYALDSVRQQCVWEHSCGGSIFGAPALDTAKRRVYIASTSGNITAIHTEPSPHVLWTVTCDAPVFGSPTVDGCTHFVICTLVNGFVTAITAEGGVAWKVGTQGPVFAAGCLSPSLPGQLLVCSRDGCIYSIKPDSGHILWKHCFDDPITASCCVDDSLQLLCKGNGADNTTTSRLVGICTAGGTVSLLRVNTGKLQEMVSDFAKPSSECSVVVQQGQRICSMDGTTVGYEIVKLNLPGEIFSSPVMVGGRLFVGCRDNNVYALDLRYVIRS